jgi:gas vesicle protein
MGQSTEELRQDIEQSRINVGRDLDAIGDRVSPRRMMERRAGRVRRWGRQAKERMFGKFEDVGTSAGDTAQSVADAARSAPEAARRTTQGNPMLTGALAFGAGFLLAVLFAPSDTEEELVEKAADRMGGMQPIREELQSAVSEIGSAASDAGKDAVQQVKQEASQHAGQLSDEAKGTAAEVKNAASS